MWKGRMRRRPTPRCVETELMDQRTLQDWVLRPLLKSVPGVIDVNGMGRVRRTSIKSWSIRPSSASST